MTYARQRADLEKLYIPTKGGGHIDLRDWTPCWQPDELDSEEFNTVIISLKRPVLLASIDLEFKEDV